MRYPIFQTPELSEAESAMRQDTMHGFLVEDPRPLLEILNTDQKEVAALGLTHEAIATELSRLTAEGEKGLGEPVDVNGRFRVTVSAARGKLPCPFGHPGLYPKTVVTLTRTDTGETLTWSALSLHMVAEHGFYQGQGSAYRMEPADIARILELPPAGS